MKVMLWLFLANLATILLIAAAFVLAYTGKDGWGWFLFISIFFAVSTEQKKEKKAETDSPTFSDTQQ